MSSRALGGESHFIVHDVEGDSAAWSPREVVIQKSTDLEGRLSFVLDNAMPRTHAFETSGLFAQIMQINKITACYEKLIDAADQSIFIFRC